MSPRLTSVIAEADSEQLRRISPEEILNVICRPLSDLRRMFHRQQLLVDRQNRAAIAVRELKIESTDIDALPGSAQRRVLTMKVRRIDAIRAIQDASPILA